MKIFKAIQRRYATLGFSPSNQTTERWPVNKRILAALLLLAYLILAQLVHLFSFASGFMEYVVSITLTSASFITFVSFAAIVYRKTTLFDCIENIEKTIETSELYSIISEIVDL